MNNNRISWLTSVPVGDGNWKCQADNATIGELREALSITLELNKTQSGQKSKITALERLIKKREKVFSKFTNINVSEMDRDVAIVVYKNKIYEDVNHQFALEFALNQEGKSMGIDLDNKIDEAAKLTHEKSKNAKIYTYDIYVDRDNKKYLVSHYEENLHLSWELMKDYALKNNLIIGTFCDFNRYICKIFSI